MVIYKYTKCEKCEILEVQLRNTTFLFRTLGVYKIRREDRRRSTISKRYIKRYRFSLFLSLKEESRIE